MCKHYGLIKSIQENKDIAECCMVHGNQPPCLKCPDCKGWIESYEQSNIGIIRMPDLFISPICECGSFMQTLNDSDDIELLFTCSKCGTGMTMINPKKTGFTYTNNKES